MDIKCSVLYFSKTGGTRRMAQLIAAGMESAGDVEARAFPLEELDLDFIKESRCVVLGTPTYLASMAAQMKDWLDGPSRACDLAGKLGGAFATADYIHGGGDLAIQGIQTHLLVRGMLVYSGGGSQGKPYIHLGPVAIKEHLEDFDATFQVYGARMASKALELFG